MNSKWHLWISIIKSIVRVMTCILAFKFNSIKLLAFGFLFAEVLGILEELGDKR